MKAESRIRRHGKIERGERRRATRASETAVYLAARGTAGLERDISSATRGFGERGIGERGIGERGFGSSRLRGRDA